MVRFEQSKIDPITAWIEKAVKWGLTHRQPVLVVVGTILIGGLFTTYVGYHIYRLRKTYWDRLAVAQGQAAQKKFDDAIRTIDEIKARRISGTLVTHADILKGDILFSQKKFSEAIKTYRNAYQHTTKEDLQPLALANLATAQEQNGQLKEALSSYEKFLEDYPEHFLTARTYSSVARVQEALGSYQEAEAMYERLITFYPTTVWARTSRMYIERLKYLKERKTSSKK